MVCLLLKIRERTSHSVTILSSVRFINFVGEL